MASLGIDVWGVDLGGGVDAYRVFESLCLDFCSECFLWIRVGQHCGWRAGLGLVGKLKKCRGWCRGH